MENIIICAKSEVFLPFKATEGAVCWDVFCTENATILAGEIYKMPLGIKTYLPQGRGIRMYARSSLPTKKHLMLANATAIFDSDFRGEYLAQLYNFTTETVGITVGERIAQIEICEVFPCLHQEIPSVVMKADQNLFMHFEEQYPSQRGSGGIGSTGK